MLFSMLVAILCFPKVSFGHSNIYHIRPSEGRVIQPYGCQDPETKEEGVCMFSWNCQRANGTHLTYCMDRFYFGSCCKLPPGTYIATPPSIVSNEVTVTQKPKLRPSTTERPSTESYSLKTEEKRFSLLPTKVPPTEFPPGLVTWRPLEETVSTHAPYKKKPTKLYSTKPLFGVSTSKPKTTEEIKSSSVTPTTSVGSTSVQQQSSTFTSVTRRKTRPTRPGGHTKRKTRPTKPYSVRNSTSSRVTMRKTRPTRPHRPTRPSNRPTRPSVDATKPTVKPITQSTASKIGTWANILDRTTKPLTFPTRRGTKRPTRRTTPTPIKTTSKPLSTVSTTKKSTTVASTTESVVYRKPTTAGYDTSRRPTEGYLASRRPITESSPSRRPPPSRRPTTELVPSRRPTAVPNRRPTTVTVSVPTTEAYSSRRPTAAPVHTRRTTAASVHTRKPTVAYVSPQRSTTAAPPTQPYVVSEQTPKPIWPTSAQTARPTPPTAQSTTKGAPSTSSTLPPSRTTTTTTVEPTIFPDYERPEEITFPPFPGITHKSTKKPAVPETTTEGSRTSVSPTRRSTTESVSTQLSTTTDAVPSQDYTKEHFDAHTATEEENPATTDVASITTDSNTKLASDTTEQRFTMTNTVDSVTSENNRPQALYDAYGNELSSDTVADPFSSEYFSADSHNTVLDVSETDTADSVASRTEVRPDVTASFEILTDASDLDVASTQNGEMTFDPEVWKETTDDGQDRLHTLTANVSESEARPTSIDDVSYATTDDFSSRNAVRNSSVVENASATAENNGNLSTTNVPIKIIELMNQKRKPPNVGVQQGIYESTSPKNEEPHVGKLKTTALPINVYEDLYDIYDYYDDLLLHDFHPEKATTIRGLDIVYEMTKSSQRTSPPTTTLRHTQSFESETYTEGTLTSFADTHQTMRPVYANPIKNKITTKPFAPTIPHEMHIFSKPTIPTKNKPFFPAIPFEANLGSGLKTSTTERPVDLELTTLAANPDYVDKATTITVDEGTTDLDPNQSWKTTVVTIDNHRPPVVSTEITDELETSPSEDEDHSTSENDAENSSSLTRTTVKYPFPTIQMEHTTKYPPYVGHDSSVQEHQADATDQVWKDSQSTFDQYTKETAQNTYESDLTLENEIDQTKSTLPQTSPEDLPVPEKWVSDADTYELSTEGNAQSMEADSTNTHSESTTTSAHPTVAIEPLTSEKSVTELSATEPPTFSTTTVTVPTTTEIDLSSADYKEVCGRPMPGPIGRIVGGGKSYFGEWPWVVSLRQWKKNTFLHKCGATLLNEFWAITAAHCVENVPLSDILLRLGEYDISHEQEPLPFVERRVQIVASHPKFDRRTFEYDLALLRFYEPVTFQKNILPACVPEGNNSYVGKYATVAGWGRLYEDGPLPDVIQEVALPVITNKLCESMYRQAGFVEDIPDIFICAGYADGGKDSCEGDSGGPMVIQEDDGRWVLAGVISWGIGCALPNQPGVYTRITKFAEWINQIIIF